MSLQKLVQKKLDLEHQWANQVLKQNTVTPNMQWIDIEVKDLKTTNKWQNNLQGNSDT